MSLCDVDFSDASDDADPVEFLDSRVVRRSRKALTCSECGEAIPVGSEYERVTYRFEGEFSSERHCSACRESAAEFGFHMLGGLLWEHFEEAWDGGSPLQACLNRLTSADAKAHMQRRWLAWKEKRAEFKRRQADRKKDAHAPKEQP